MSLIGAETFHWKDPEKRGVIMYRVPRNIKLNDNIVVREDEYAVFFRDGKVLAYIDRPDRYALTSINAPIVGRIVEALSGVRQRAELIWLQKKVFDGKYGSKQAYPFKDPDFGIVNLRIFGEFRYRVIAPENFINQFVGTLNISTAAEVEARIREQMVVLIYDVLGDLKERGMGVTDIASKLTEIEQFVLDRAVDHYEMYGLEVQKLSGLYISMPEEVQKAVDTRSAMQVTGTDYMTLKTGAALEDAANNPSGGGGLAGMGLGLGAGAGMGYTMMDTMARSQGGGGGQGGQAQAGAPGTTTACIKCQAMIPVGTKFCPQCGEAQGVICPSCGASVSAGDKFCGDCGGKMGMAVCPKCDASVTAGDKFCPQCGNTL